MSNVAVIGLGIMGLPMAKNLVTAGYDVVGFNRSQDKIDQLVEAGGKGASSVAESVANADVVITMVPDSPDVEGVVTGEDGQANADLNAVEGTVLDASYIGVSTQYLVETRDGHRMTAYAQNLETAGLSELLTRGERVRLTWNPRHTFVVAGSAEHVDGDPHAPEEEGEPSV